VARDDRLRLFVALCLPANVLDRLVAWQENALAGRPGVRVVARDQLHVTVAFLGSRPAGERDEIAAAVRRAASGAAVPAYVVRRYRETQRVGMLVLGEQLQGDDRYVWRGSALAGGVMLALDELGVYRRESRDWLPHVTVARFRTRPGLAASPPDLGTFSPSEVALYHSSLRPTGAQYDILDAVSLGG
jgi:2'-5' RNA ligase